MKKYLATSFLSLTLSVALVSPTFANSDSETSPLPDMSTWNESERQEYLTGREDYLELKKEYSTTGKSVENYKSSNLVEPMATPRPSGSMGNTGDVLITMSGSSSTHVAWVGGHAALVVDGYNTIEAFGNAGSTKDGVRYWSNNFRNRYSDAKGYSVSGTTSVKRQTAVNYAKTKLYSPYNFNFFNKFDNTTYYCSQIVWRAWQQQGIDLDYNGGTAVWPGDLDKSSKLFRSS